VELETPVDVGFVVCTGLAVWVAESAGAEAAGVAVSEAVVTGGSEGVGVGVGVGMAEGVGVGVGGAVVVVGFVEYT
jgi:hypothetical protein